MLEKNLKKNIQIYGKLNHFAVYLKLIQCYKLTILQFKNSERHKKIFWLRNEKISDITQYYLTVPNELVKLDNRDHGGCHDKKGHYVSWQEHILLPPLMAVLPEKK